MFGSCAASVVLLPSAASHLPLTVPPTPLANGVTTTSLGLLSLNGAPMKPQTTGRFCPGVAGTPAWMCALPRLSLTSALCEPVKSMLKTVALNVIAVCASFSVNVAVPNERRAWGAGRRRRNGRRVLLQIRQVRGEHRYRVGGGTSMSTTRQKRQ